MTLYWNFDGALTGGYEFGMQFSKARLWADDPLTWQLNRWWMLAVSFTHCYVNFSMDLQECSQDMPPGNPQCEWIKRKQGRTHNGFCHLALEIIHYHFCNLILLITKSRSSQYERELYKGINTMLEPVTTILDLCHLHK